MEANKKELHEGVAGNGDTTWVVATVDSKGNWIWAHHNDLGSV
jgi:hypothetical protein